MLKNFSDYNGGCGDPPTFLSYYSKTIKDQALRKKVDIIVSFIQAYNKSGKAVDGILNGSPPLYSQSFTGIALASLGAAVFALI